jgi:hypothetical protein
MPRQTTPDLRTGPRYLAAHLIQAEWDDQSGMHVVEEGETENVGPEGALVHLQRHLPDVGSRVQLAVLDESGLRLKVITEVLRLERNAGHPLAALQLVDAHDEWRGMVWEPSAPQLFAAPSEDIDEEDFD